MFDDDMMRRDVLSDSARSRMFDNNNSARRYAQTARAHHMVAVKKYPLQIALHSHHILWLFPCSRRCERFSLFHLIKSFPFEWFASRLSQLHASVVLNEFFTKSNSILILIAVQNHTLLVTAIPPRAKLTRSSWGQWPKSRAEKSVGKNAQAANQSIFVSPVNYFV